VPTAELPDILVVDVDAETYAGVLGRSFRVVTVNRTAAAFEQLAQRVPSAIVADLDRVDGSALDLITRARGFSRPPAILVTTAEPERVPDAIGAGCDSVLLKPFPPNLICSRLGRLVRSRHESLRQQWSTCGSAPLARAQNRFTFTSAAT
jgi:DNA-binding response OmpR family regulator